MDVALNDAIIAVEADAPQDVQPFIDRLAAVQARFIAERDRRPFPAVLCKASMTGPDMSFDYVTVGSALDSLPYEAEGYVQGGPEAARLALATETGS